MSAIYSASSPPARTSGRPSPSSPACCATTTPRADRRPPRAASTATSPSGGRSVPEQPNGPSAMQGLLLRPGQPPLATVQSYQAAGGYVALRQALTMRPEQVIEEIRGAQLRGRGGAGVLAAEKLFLVAQ